MFLSNNTQFRLLEASLDAATLRQKVIANNIANVDTPHFKRSEVQFEELLQSQLARNSTLTGYRTHPKHIPIGHSASMVQPQIHTDELSSMNNNYNNVDIDYEMALLAKNQLRYNVMVEQTNGYMKKLRTAIEGR